MFGYIRVTESGKNVKKFFFFLIFEFPDNINQLEVIYILIYIH